MKNKKLFNISIISAIYVVLCMVLEPFSFGVIQFRISELLCLLSIELPYTIIANTLGCLIANMLLGGLGIIDTIIGSLATLLACIFAYLLRNYKYNNLPIFSCLSIVITNGLLIGIELGIITNNIDMIPITILQITISEFIIIMIIGLPIYNKMINIVKSKQRNIN